MIFFKIMVPAEYSNSTNESYHEQQNKEKFKKQKVYSKN